MSFRLVGCVTRSLFRTVGSDTALTQRVTKIVAPKCWTQCNTLSFYEKKYYATYLNSISGDNLRNGMNGVSNAGAKKGRLRTTRKMVNLNLGQKHGQGRANFSWPGLSGPASYNGYKIRPKRLPKDTSNQEQLIKLRDMKRARRVPLTPLERGYTGTKLPGQKIGPPDPIGDHIFEGFQSIVLEYKTVSTMTGTVGRRMRFSAFVVTGNGNGIAGYGLAKARNAKAAVRLAKNRAAQNLLYVPRFENHTVYHNMYSKFWRSKIFIHKKEEGYGLRCHRVLKSICQVLGIKNLHCKVEGSTGNVQNVTKAFFNALTNQETHSELAERIGYNVVEFKKEQEYRPRLIAAPRAVKKEELIDEIEDLEVDFERLYYKGRCELPRKPVPWHYLNDPSYLKSQEKLHSRRNQYQSAIIRLAGLD